MSKTKKMYIKMKYKNKAIQWQDDSINQLAKNHDAHQQPLTNVPTNGQLPTLYGFRDNAFTKF